MPPPSLESRYAAASEHAKRLPQKLLTNSQRLKLYALFKQAEGPAPAQGPPFFQAVARAKWEAWNDVRSLSAQQAMESYCSIIEGLVAITQGTLGANGGTKVGVTQQEEAREHPHAGESAAQVVTALEGGAPSATSTTPARNTEDEGCDGADEPVIDAQRWAATALSLGPSTVFEVPIAVSEPSLCRYSFNVAAADGSAVGFSIGPANGPPLATVRAAEHEGQVEVHGDGTTMLIAKLDNSAVFSHLVVACEVRFLCGAPCACMLSIGRTLSSCVPRRSPP